MSEEEKFAGPFSDFRELSEQVVALIKLIRESGFVIKIDVGQDTILRKLKLIDVLNIEVKLPTNNVSNGGDK